LVQAQQAVWLPIVSEDPETTVLLLEAVTGYKTRDSNPSRLKLLGSEVDWGYFSEPELPQRSQDLFRVAKS